MIFLSFSVPARSDWHQDYKDGEKALKKKQYANASALFRRALNERKEPGKNLMPSVGLLGGVIKNYCPRLKLAVALSHQPGNEKEVSRLLKRRGVDSWGHMIVKGTIMISVRQTQARWAQHLLDQAGIPLENHLAGEQASQSPQTRPKSHRGEQSDSLGDALREIGDLRLF